MENASTQPRNIYEEIARKLENRPQKILDHVKSQESFAPYNEFMARNVADILTLKIDKNQMEVDTVKKVDLPAVELNRTSGTLQSAAKRVLARMRLHGSSSSLPLKEVHVDLEKEQEDIIEIPNVRITMIILADHHMLASFRDLKTCLSLMKSLQAIDRLSIEKNFDKTEIGELNKQFIVISRDIAGETISTPILDTEEAMQTVLNGTKKSIDVPEGKISLRSFDARNNLAQLEQMLNTTRQKGQTDVIMYYIADNNGQSTFKLNKNLQPYFAISHNPSNDVTDRFLINDS